MAINGNDILNSYMRGVSFVNQNLDRIERAKKAEELEQAAEVAGKGIELFAPRYDSHGQLIRRTAVDIFNDPKALDVANHPFMKDVRMQGITDPEVADVKYVAGIPTKDGRVVPMMQHFNEDGEPLGPPGPLTADRSKGSEAKVVPSSLDDMYSHVVAKVYATSPELGTAMKRKSDALALAGLQTQYRHAQSPEEQDHILQTAGSYGINAKELIAGAALGHTVQDLNGVDKITDANGNVTLAYNPKTRNLGDALTTNRADLDQDIKEKLFAREQALKTINAENARATQEKLDDQYLDKGLARKANEDSAKNESALAITSNNVARIRHATEVLSDPSATPEDKTQARSLMDGFGKTPEGARILERTSQAEKILDVPKLLSGGASASQAAIEDFAPYLPPDEQKGLLAKLTSAVENGNPAALPARRSLLRVMQGPAADAQRGEAPKPGEYNPTAVAQYTKQYLPEDEQSEVSLKGESLFRDAAKVVRPAKDSIEETELNRATARALSEKKPDHVLPLYNWMQLEKNPTFRTGAGSSEDFLTDIHEPIVQLNKKHGHNLSPDALAMAERMAAGLMTQRVDADDAVTAAVQYQTDPDLRKRFERAIPEDVSGPEQERAFYTAWAKDLSSKKGPITRGAEYAGRGLRRMRQLDSNAE